MRSMKACSVCKETKHLDEFHRDSCSPDGRVYRCKTCTAAYDAARRSADLGRYAARQRAWRAANPAAADAIEARSTKKQDPKKQAARRRTRRAIKSGALVRPTKCESCGEPAATHAHHDDYDRPLDVRFLCEGCHLRVHGKTLRKVAV